MSTISIRLHDTLIHQIDQLADILQIHRSEYIKQALEKMNKEVLRSQRYERMKNASLLVRQESKIINQEFEAVSYEPKN